VIGLVVEETGFLLHRPGEEGVDAHAVRAIERAEAVEAATHIGRIAQGDETLRAERHLLASRAQRRRRRIVDRQIDVDEGLLDVEPVDIGGDAQIAAPGLHRVAELHEGAEIAAEMEIGIQQQPVEEIILLRSLAQAEEGLIVMPVSLAQLAAQRQVELGVIAELDVFERIPNIVAPRRVGEIAEIVVRSGLAVRRARGIGLPRAARHRIAPAKAGSTPPL